MPKTKLGEKFSAQEPPVDWLWAMVLERQKVKKISLKKMADVADVSYDYMRRLINKSPWDWPRYARERVCNYLGINLVVTPNGIELEEKK